LVDGITNSNEDYSHELEYEDRKVDHFFGANPCSGMCGFMRLI
jgi:hypothetical protein